MIKEFDGPPEIFILPYLDFNLMKIWSARIFLIFELLGERNKESAALLYLEKLFYAILGPSKDIFSYFRLEFQGGPLYQIFCPCKLAIWHCVRFFIFATENS